MAINFPTSIDSLTNNVDNVDTIVAQDVNDLNDAVEALEAKVGIDSSAITTSHDYKLSGVTGAEKAASKTYVDNTFVPLAGGTLTGDIQLGETDIKLDATLSGDETWSGIVIAGTLGATIAVGDLCYLNADDSRWELVDANLSDGYDKMLGICVLAGNDGSATEMLVFGKIRSDAFPVFTVGSPLYMSETAGDVTHTQPSTADVCIRKIGFAITAEDLFFNPSTDYIIHT